MRKYMRDRFDFVGLKRPHYRNIIRPLFTTFLRELQPVEIKAVVKDLWAQSEREFQYVAIDWALRSYARTDENRVRTLLAELKVSPLALREASRRMTR
jgi:3-methyladenine DNA glycosylase AlkD